MRRLYVLVSKDLSPVYGCVQGGHAVAQYLLEHPSQKWNNQYLIYLYADTVEWAKKLSKMGASFSCFREPDLEYKLTALAIEDNSGELFKHLKLVR